MPLAIAACGAGPTATPLPASAAPAQTPTQTAPVAGWTASLPVGGNVGQLAPDTPVLLPDGTTKELSEVAAGKPMLLHFFATW